MFTKVPPSKVQEDDDLSPPRRRAATADHFSLPRLRDLHPRDDNDSTRQDRPSRSHQQESSTHRCQPKEEPSSTHRRSKRQCLAERYAQWSRGLAQVRQSEDAFKDYLEEAEKPLARYRHDKDLDNMLKQKEHQDDPMLKYLSNKTSDIVDRPNNSSNAPVKPHYRGPDYQTNRFNIWAGYRWDGLDRSNGFEKKLFASIANQYVQSQRDYLWNVKDI